MSRFFPLPSAQDTTIKAKGDRLQDPAKKTAYTKVLTHFSDPGLVINWTPVKAGEAPSINSQATGRTSESGPLTDDEKIWLSQECIIRFLIADTWDHTKTIPRLMRTFRWRREMSLYDVQGMSVELEALAARGKLYVTDYARAAYPLIYWHADKRRDDPTISFSAVRMMFYIIERSMDLMVAEVEEVGFLCDMSGKPDKSWAAVNINKQILHDIQTYYPETLGFAAVQNLGMFGKLLVNVMWPFVDPYTKKKVTFDLNFSDGKMAKPQAVPKSFGGSGEFVWDAPTHWVELRDECLARRHYRQVKWEELGGGIGLSEVDTKVPLGIDPRSN